MSDRSLILTADTAQAERWFGKLLQRSVDLSGLMAQIGEDLTESIQGRFDAGIERLAGSWRAKPDSKPGRLGAPVWRSPPQSAPTPPGNSLNAFQTAYRPELSGLRGRATSCTHRWARTRRN